MRSSLPVALADLENGLRFDWDPSSPHTNVAGPDGRRATVIALGDEFTPDTALDLADKAADYIGRWSSDPNKIIEARQRLHVWYRDANGQAVLSNPDRYINYDDPHSESPFDIARSK
jgi:hypothetical protein